MPLLRSFFQEMWWFKSTIIMILTPVIIFSVIPAVWLTQGYNWLEGKCLMMLLLMAVYWCTETTHLAVTSLIPLMLSPILGIMKADDVSRQYLKDLNIMFLGGLMVAACVEHSQLHRRIAISVLKLVGPNPRLLMLGFMIPTWFLSMWISNTATTAMMIAIVQAVIDQLEGNISASVEKGDAEASLPVSNGEAKINPVFESDDVSDRTGQDAVLGSFSSEEETPTKLNGSELLATEQPETEEPRKEGKWRNTAKALSLCVCYSATCGGIATLTGTTPNVVLAGNVESFSKSLNNYDFGFNFTTWMGFALPISFVVVLLCWIWLQIIFIGFRDKQTPTERQLISDVIDREYKSLGRIMFKEVVVLVHFILLALLWITRNLGGVGGWGMLFPSGYATDATAAITISISLFLWPSEMPDYFCWRGGCGSPSRTQNHPKPRKSLITWDVIVHKVPWGLILLLGGGFALAESISVSGLSETIGNSLNFFEGWPMWGVVMCISLITAGITEITSNTAISTIFLPIVGRIALKLGKSPLYLQLPVCVASSFAFMLPVATPPNALVFATGVLQIKDMAKIGIVMNLIGVLAATLATVTWGAAMFDLDSFPYTNGTLPNITAVDSGH